MLIVFLVLICSSFTSVTFYITGQVQTRAAGKAEKTRFLSLFLKFNGRVIAEDITDSTGHYDFSFNEQILSNEKGSFEVYMTGIGMDTSLLKANLIPVSEETTLDLIIPVKPRRKFGKVVCPKCGKSGRVYPISYGLKQLVVRENHPEDTLNSKIVRGKYYDGGCVSGLLSPHWYCDKDKVKF